MSNIKYPHLARFLADHFGGYEDAPSAAIEEADGDVDRYVADFTKGLKIPDRLLKTTDEFLEKNSDFDKLRKSEFDDAGNPNPTSNLPFALVKIVRAWN